jgi:hypothetical protein
VEMEKYAYSFFGGRFLWVVLRSGVLLLPPAQKPVDPAAHRCSVSLLLHAGAVSVRRQALCAGSLQQADLGCLLRRARKNGYAVGARQLNKVEGW